MDGNGDGRAGSNGVAVLSRDGVTWSQERRRVTASWAAPVNQGARNGRHTRLLRVLSQPLGGGLHDCVFPVRQVTDRAPDFDVRLQAPALDGAIE